MAKQLHFCRSCNMYTLKGICPTCSQPTILPKPAKFSMDDKYGKHRREARKEELQKKNLY